MSQGTKGKGKSDGWKSNQEKRTKEEIGKNLSHLWGVKLNHTIIKSYKIEISGTKIK
jgi:hypothetical protein